MNGLSNLDLGRAERWRGKLPIPEHASPLVRKLFMIMNGQKATIRDVAGRAGLRPGTVSDWRYRREPTVSNLEAALNSLGYELRIVAINRPV